MINRAEKPLFLAMVFANPSYQYINPSKGSPSTKNKHVLKKRAKQFIDISLSFEPHPLTKDLTILRNERAINNAIKNLVLIISGEVPFQANVGSRVRDYMFEGCDESTAMFVEAEIEQVIRNFEPRAELMDKGDVMAMGTAEIRAQQQMDNFNSNQYGEIEATFNDFYSAGIADMGVHVDARPDQNELMVTITYKIIGYDQTFTVEQILTPTR